MTTTINTTVPGIKTVFTPVGWLIVLLLLLLLLYNCCYLLLPSQRVLPDKNTEVLSQHLLQYHIISSEYMMSVLGSWHSNKTTWHRLHDKLLQVQIWFSLFRSLLHVFYKLPLTPDQSWTGRLSLTCPVVQTLCDSSMLFLLKAFTTQTKECRLKFRKLSFVPEKLAVWYWWRVLILVLLK